MKLPQDVGGRAALGLGAAVVLAGTGSLVRAARLSREMEKEGVPATSEWAVALRSARRPDELTGAGISFIVAGLAIVVWAMVRASRA